MSKNMHGYEVVVGADKSDWGIKWGLAPIGDKRCWCYECSMTRPTPLAPDRAKRVAKSKPSASKRSKGGAAGKA